MISIMAAWIQWISTKASLRLRMLLACLAALLMLGGGPARNNLIDDPSFELTKERDQSGLVFAKWSGWKFEGDCEFAVGRVAHSGRTSALLIGNAAPKIRIFQSQELVPGRYRITAYLRGLDIGVGPWNSSTEFMFDEQYLPLSKQGTFGWTKLTYVSQITAKKKAAVSFGLMAPGYFWIDDVAVEKVADDVPLTPKPVLGSEEAPIASPAAVGAHSTRCPLCGYRNTPTSHQCYACGSPLAAHQPTASGPRRKLITSFEDRNPFGGGTRVTEHATDGSRALRIDRGYVSLDGPQNWTGYDFLMADVYTDSKDPLELTVEIRDTATQDYWTRVNYSSVVPPGKSTFVLPIKQLYVGEKSRPGRMLMQSAITRLVLSIAEKPGAPLFVDNLRLERDESADKVLFEGLYAFDLGTETSPVLEGFTQITPATRYSKGRGYGLLDAKVWRAFDALQPEPLHQDFICIESGGLAVDVPNGKYRVLVSMDGPSGYWGEYQVYRRRAIIAQGREVVSERMDYDSFKKKYFRFWNVDDLPTDNTFNKYQRADNDPKTFEVDVTDGQLRIGFQGENWACSVSAIVIYPAAKAAQGERFLRWVEDKRRFYFDNNFKRILHRGVGEPIPPSAEDEQRGYVPFQREPMREVFYNDKPARGEIGKALAAEAFPGQRGTMTLALLPMRNLGKVTVEASDLVGPSGTIPSTAIDVGYVSYRISRVTMEGSVYTIAPRLIMPSNSVEMPNDVTRRFWVTVRTPAKTAPGEYRGHVVVKPQHGTSASLPVVFTVHKGGLDPVDLPVGPFGYSIRTPWYEDDAQARSFNEEMSLKSMKKLREYGFTTFSGIPTVYYRGFKAGHPELDFTAADPVMKQAKELGFLAVIAYGGGLVGLNAYQQDTEAMKAAGFTDYSAFIKAIYAAVMQHAREKDWLPVYWNLGDEPIGDDLLRSVQNAAAYRRAFPVGPPFFTAASSFSGRDQTDLHFLLSRDLSVANWNGHDEDSVNLLKKFGGSWAFYNGANRWTYGTYLYKAAKQFGLKFRVAWHWNIAAGDPYYALDCREDDYAWSAGTPTGQLVPSVEFEQIQMGLDDYRLLLTLARLAKQHAASPAAAAANAFINRRMASFKLGQREHDSVFPSDDWEKFRKEVANLIDALR
jgi:hypothetical protein